MDDTVIVVAFPGDPKGPSTGLNFWAWSGPSISQATVKLAKEDLIMKSLLARFLVTLVLCMVSSCATVSTEKRELLAPGELRLLSVQFPEFGRIRQMVKYLANIKFESDGEVEIRRACFYWDAVGPNCFGIMDVNYGERIIRADVATPGSGYYVMKCYVLYVRNGNTIRSNMVETPVEIAM